jgi:hypothetical protein
MGQLSKRLETALEAVRTWPLERQDDAADTLLAMHAQGVTVYRLSDDERRDIERSLQQAERREFATAAQVAAVLKRHGL